MNRVISSVVRVAHYTTSGFPIVPPMRVVSLCGCVHHAVSDEPVGVEIECSSCGDLAPMLAKVREFMASGQFSHVTERSMACNNERSWTSFYFYRIDRTSPTQCILEFGAPCCEEVRAVIGECGTRALPGPSRGQFARC